jgi:hypothetical protein
MLLDATVPFFTPLRLAAAHVGQTTLKASAIMENGASPSLASEAGGTGNEDQRTDEQANKSLRRRDAPKPESAKK